MSEIAFQKDSWLPSLVPLAALLVLGVCGCGHRIEKSRAESPDGSCVVTISDYFRTPILVDPNIEIEVRCGWNRSASYRGSYDWMYKHSAVKWDMTAKRVKVVVCGHIAPAVDAEFDLTPPLLKRVNAEGIKRLGRKKDGRALLAPAARDGSDLFLRVTCYAEDL